MPATSFPPKTPGRTVVPPPRPLVISHTACASCSVAFAAARVARGAAGRFGAAGPGGGRAASGSTSGGRRGQVDGTACPSTHACTASAAQPDGSAVTVLCPTPGTTSRCPWGKRATTDAAPAVGVRMSKPPLPAGAGQPRQKSALPNPADHAPNGPNVPGGRAAIAAFRIALRSGIGVSGCQGNGPSRQTVAA